MSKIEQQGYSKEDYDKTAEGAEGLKNQIQEAAAAGQYGKVAELSGQLTEAENGKKEMFGNAQEEAEAENETQKKAEAERATTAEQAVAEAYALESAENDQARMAEIRAGLKGEGAVAVEDAEPIIESSEDSIENEPLSPVMEKYKQKIEDIISQSKQFAAQAEELKKQGKDEEAWEFQSKANHKSYEIFQGGGDTFEESFIEITHKNQEIGETYSEFQKKRSAPVEEYRKALYDSPQMILRVARETGRLNWQNISGRLLRDKKFVEMISKTEEAKNDPYFQVALRDNLFDSYANKSRY